jgi:hypothetical protein
MDSMEQLECPECDRLREVYRRATRNELDLMIRLDRDLVRNDLAALQELRHLLATVGMARATASQNILDHENSHCRRTSPHKRFAVQPLGSIHLAHP